MLGTVMLQALYYFIAMMMIVGLFAGLLRGFLFKYIKVRTSFGKYFLLKIRSHLRDYYEIGRIEEGFIVYKHAKKELRVSISDNTAFYKSLGVNWIDINEQTKAVCKVDYTSASGYDAEKFSDLLTRALMRPAIESGKEKLIFIFVIATSIMVLVTLFLSYMNYAMMKELMSQLPSLIENLQQMTTIIR